MTLKRNYINLKLDMLDNFFLKDIFKKEKLKKKLFYKNYALKIFGGIYFRWRKFSVGFIFGEHFPPKFKHTKNFDRQCICNT